MTKVTTVARPEMKRSGRKGMIAPLHARLLETLTTGQAIRCELNDVPLERLRARFSSFASAQKFKLRSQRDGDALVAWLEERDSK